MMWAPSDKLLTLKDIANAVSIDRSEAGIAKTMRQVRHWTQNDLLRTLSAKETGKGVPRMYHDELTIEIAAVLVELSRYGVTVDVLKHVADELWESDEGTGAILAAQTEDIESFLQVSWESEPTTGKLTGANIELFDIHELVSYSKRDFVPLETETPSSILVNMTAVLRRVHSNL